MFMRILKIFGAVLGVILLLGVGGFFYLSEPDVPREELIARYGQSPSAFVTLPSGAVAHYRDQGRADGTPLLLLHGSNASLHTWEPWAKILGDQFRIISVDLPGHGLTGRVPGDDYSQLAMARFVDQFASAIGLTRFAIGGNSMGGGVAARFAIMLPERVTRLILVDAGGVKWPGDSQLPLVFRLAQTPIVRDLMLHVTPRFVFEENLRGAFGKDEVINDAMIDRYFELARMPGSREATLIRLNTPRDYYVGEHLDEIRAPTLILWGREDTWTPLSMGETYKAGIARSEMIVFDGVGHIPMEEVPEESAATVRAFLGR